LHFDVTPAVVADLPELADVAAQTFPLACPPSASAANIAAFIDENLTEDRFRGYLADPDRAVLVVREDARMVGYAMLVRDGDGIELSKIYVLPGSHGGGASAALMASALDTARELGAASVWLGVNQHNQRAQRFYAKQGFTVSGTRTFALGEDIENDYVMVRPV
jgi:ribosomal protein S18 acetylase RimI-like enzyme